MYCMNFFKKTFMNMHTLRDLHNSLVYCSDCSGSALGTDHSHGTDPAAILKPDLSRSRIYRLACVGDELHFKQVRGFFVDAICDC